MIYDEQLEQNILGSIMYLKGYGDSVDLALDTLKPVDFYFFNNRSIFSAMLDLKKKNLNPDFSAVSGHREINRNQDPLFFYVMELFKNTSSGLNLVHWIESLSKVSELRRTQDIVNNISQIISDNKDLEEKLLEINTLFDVDIGVNPNADTGAKHISSHISDYVDYLDKRWNKPDEVVFTTGIDDLDKILGGGFEIGLHAIAARPKMGKTELMVKMINHFAIDRELPIYIGTLEMAGEQIVHRMTSALSRVDKDEIKNNFTVEGVYDDLSKSIFSKALMDLQNTNTYIDDRHNNTVKKIRRELLKVQKKHGYVGGVFIDYLGLLSSDGAHDRHDLSIAAMTRALKGMSKEFKCPVVLLLQLNRSLEARNEKKPIPSDSRDSGAIEQDVDSWTAIYRDSVYNTESPWGAITEIIVRLNRHGDTGTCYQLLTGHGFKNADESKVAKLLHDAEVKESEKNKKYKGHQEEDKGF